MMKRLGLLASLVIAVTMLTAPIAFGYSIQIYQNAYSYSNGGEFTIVSDDLSMVSSAYTGPYTKGVLGNSTFNFESFCLEFNEHFNPGTTYYAEINSNHSALSGDSAAGFDVISEGTAWLYFNFVKGTLTGYDYTGTNRRTSAGLLQQAIWFLEDENQGSIGNLFVQRVIEEFGSLESAKANYTGSAVDVLNVWSDKNKTGFKQDQLIDGPAGVPEPTTLLLLGLGMIGLGMTHRKFKK